MKPNVCPIPVGDEAYPCSEECAWFDGERCVIWRLVFALEGIRSELKKAKP